MMIWHLLQHGFIRLQGMKSILRILKIYKKQKQKSRKIPFSISGQYAGMICILRYL
jgi:hypothetical protein